MDAASRGYCNLEFDLAAGLRGSRHIHGEQLLCQLTGAEAALKGKKMRDGVVTACAAAVKGARPLSGNVYKVKATKGIMEKALTSLA
jgi:L-seryl-tRNA(Ser) seleniumtransferase